MVNRHRNLNEDDDIVLFFSHAIRLSTIFLKVHWLELSFVAIVIVARIQKF
jgi:hypothetical protein